MAEKTKKNMNFNIYCCNPFEKKGHNTIKNLRPVQDWMLHIKPSITPEMKICDSCRKQLSKEKKMLEAEDLDVPGTSTIDEDFTNPEESLHYLNKSLSNIEESPIKKKRMLSPSYCKVKLGKAMKKLTHELVGKTAIEDPAKDDPDTEILLQLKEKFKSAQSRNEQFLILTTLPKSWTCQRIQDEFNVSNRMARKTKVLVKEKGIMSCPEPKVGKMLEQPVVDKVINFYNSDEISRIMPGKKDFVSVKIDVKSSTHVQKRLVLCNLKEAYERFKEKHPIDKIGFSKFAELRPKNCVLAGGSGTHSVCVCTTHQNTKLMIVGGKLKDIPIDGETNLGDYKICLSLIMCSEATSKCQLNVCENCPGIENIKQKLINHFEEDMIENITYKQWISVDRCSFETVTKTVDEFVERFCEQLIILKRHAFIAQQQSKYYTYMKENVKENEAVINLDFSENYSFVVQDEAQSFHWNNDQATVHPVAVYYNAHGEIKYKSFVLISECLNHNTVAVHLFQKRVITFLKTHILPSIQKIYYFSDGSSAQYKNKKNFVNLCHHKNDFGINAEWHFFATAHGKSACDGLGGTVKRLAARASLHRPYSDQIMTPIQLFNWSEQNIPNIQFFYCTNKDHEQENDFLRSRFQEAKAIKGTQKYHTFIPHSETEIKTKIYSFSDIYDIQEVTEGGLTLPMNDIFGYVTCEYDRRWWLANVISKDYQNEEVEVTFLHPSGPAPSFVFPRNPDILKVHKDQILTKVIPNTVTGRTYTLNQKEMTQASKCLCTRLNPVQ